VIAASHAWPGPRARFWVPTVDDIYDGGPELAVFAGAHAGLALVIRAIEYAHGEIEGADHNDLVGMAGDIAAVDELIAIEIVRQARSLAGILRAYALERTRRVGSRRQESLEDPF
jgi:hypothetical protein